MRSSPLLLLVCVLLGFGGLAVPLSRLTTARPAPAREESHVAAAAAVPTHLRVRFAHQPERVSLRQDGRLLAEFNRPSENPAEAGIALAIDDSQVELGFEAVWPSGTPATALTIEIEPDGIDPREMTVWTDTATATGVASFAWR
jgi:hypothetical protein